MEPLVNKLLVGASSFTNFAPKLRMDNHGNLVTDNSIFSSSHPVDAFMAVIVGRGNKLLSLLWIVAVMALIVSLILGIYHLSGAGAFLNDMHGGASGAEIERIRGRRQIILSLLALAIMLPITSIAAIGYTFMR